MNGRQVQQRASARLAEKQKSGAVKAQTQSAQNLNCNPSIESQRVLRVVRPSRKQLKRGDKNLEEGAIQSQELSLSEDLQQV